MPEKQTNPQPRMTCAIPALVTRTMLRWVDELRAAFQAEGGAQGVITRSDVVRLALQRLYAAYLVHQSEGEHPTANLLVTWEALVAEVQEEGICPPWLVPGRPESVRTKPRSRKRKATPKPVKEK